MTETTGIDQEMFNQKESIFSDAQEESDEDKLYEEVQKELADISPEELMELFSSINGALENPESDDGGNTDLDADDYHNQGCDIARKGRKREAARFCMEGLEKFPLNVDLLADTIKYSTDTGDLPTADEHYSILKTSVPFRRWNWRAFTFAFDYLITKDPVENESECRTLVENYKKCLPYEERACLAESELEAALGNADLSMQVLQDAIRSHPNASQCAMRLADMQMDRGLYKDALRTVMYGAAASAAVQPSINAAYLYLIRVLAKDHALHEKEASGEPINIEEVELVKHEYDLLVREFPDIRHHAKTIKTRISMLKFIKTDS